MAKLEYIAYTNCQRRGINEHLKLSPDFCEKYQYKQLPLNFKAIANKHIIPSEMLERCQLFIYQPTSQDKYGEQSSEAILEKLPKSCICISFPYIYFNGYWPQTNKSLHTQFQQGDENIVDFFKKETPIERVIKKLNNVNFYDKDFLINRVNSTLEILKSKEESTDIKLSEFIKNNYQHKYLFHTEKHPCNQIGFEAANQILSLLNMPPITQQISQEIALAHETPIYPSVAHHLGLTFLKPDFEYKVKFSSQKVTFNQYIKKYYNRLRKGLFNQ